MITIKETTAKELDNVKALWADGDVMKFVGFPDGLLQTDDEMKAWLDWIESERPQVNHYSIFDGSVYCGETFYSIDSKHGNSASMDIKLFGFARGKGIAAKALSYAIEQAFENGAEKVWTRTQIMKKRLRFIKGLDLYKSQDRNILQKMKI